MSQSLGILNLLQSGRTLTPAMAYELFGTLALHSRISELRERGHNIECRMIEIPSGKSVGEYRLIAAPQARAV